MPPNTLPSRACPKTRLRMHVGFIDRLQFARRQTVCGWITSSSFDAKLTGIGEAHRGGREQIGKGICRYSLQFSGQQALVNYALNFFGGDRPFEAAASSGATLTSVWMPNVRRPTATFQRKKPGANASPSISVLSTFSRSTGRYSAIGIRVRSCQPADQFATE